MHTSPPRIAEWILKRVLRAADREYILGDLAERYDTRRRAAGGSARLWYWRQVLGAVGARATEAAPRLETRPRRSVLAAVSGFRSDVRIAWRGLLRSPGFTTVIVATVALGIGAITAVFAVVDGVLLRPLPFPDPDDLISLEYVAPDMRQEGILSSTGMYFTYREEARTLDDIGAWIPREISVDGTDGPERVPAIAVTADLFDVLRPQPRAGRLLRPEDDTPGAPATVLLSHSYWESRFARDPGVVGTTMSVDGRPHEITGVLPRDFELPGADGSVYLPLQLDRREAGFGGFRYHAVARLRRNATIESALDDVERMIPIAVERFDVGITVQMLDEMGFRTVIQPFRDDYIGHVAGVLWVLLSSTGIVLLIGCANVANLALVRVEGRWREVAIRTALGAGKRRIARQFLVEGLILTVMGGALGLGLAAAGVELVLGAAPATLPRLDGVGVDAATLGFAAAGIASTMIVFMAASIGRTFGMDLLPGLREGARSASTDRERHRARNALVVSQMALAFVLLAGSGSMIRTFDALRRVEPGFARPEGVLTLRATIPEWEMSDDAEVALTFEALARRLERIPGVESVGAASSLPMDGNTARDPLLVENVPWSGRDIPPIRRFRAVAGDYFRTMQNPLIVGRGIDWSDVREHAAVAVVTENFAVEYWGRASAALGKHVAMVSSTAPEENQWHEIVGVVGDVRDDGVDQPAPPIIYWPMVMNTRPPSPGSLFVPRSMVFVVRSGPGAPEISIRSLRAAVAEVDPSVPISEVRRLDSLLSGSMSRASFGAMVLALASIVALGLGMVGLYGVVSYVVRLRRRELGVRIALGASRRGLQWMVLRQAGALAFSGVVVGVVASVGLGRFVTSLVHGVAPTDPVTLAVVAALLATVAFLAASVPAMRASRTDALRSLRFE